MLELLAATFACRNGETLSKRDYFGLAVDLDGDFALEDRREALGSGGAGARCRARAEVDNAMHEVKGGCRVARYIVL